MKELEVEIDDLAAMFRGAIVTGKPEAQAMVVKRYHEVMSELFSLGWDLRLDPMSELPKDYMPEEYLRRHPPYNPFSCK